MMLLRNVLGTTTYHYHADKTVKTLRETAEGKTSFTITSPEKLRNFAGRLGLSPDGTEEEVALRICDMVETDFSRPVTEPSEIVRHLAPAERQETWARLGILPGGIHPEIMNATGSCLTNVDSSYVSLALKAMRLSVAMAYQSQIVCEYLQDVLFGIPEPHTVKVDLGGVLDPDYVNILPNGHELPRLCPHRGGTQPGVAEEGTDSRGGKGHPHHREYRDRTGDGPALGDG